MNPQKRRTSASVLISLLIIFTAAAYAQDRPQMPGLPSYEVSLQVIVGSDDAASRSQLPRDLSGVMTQLRSSYSFSSYRLANTYLGRLGNTGMVEYKSVTNIFGDESSGDTPSFLEWSLGGSRNSDISGGGNTFMAQPFKFGARIPIRFSNFKDDSGRSSSPSTVTYESIGLSTNRMSIHEGEPTLVGTLALPKTAGTLFLVLTVKPVL